MSAMCRKIALDPLELELQVTRAALGAGVLARVPISVKRQHDRGNSNKEKDI